MNRELAQDIGRRQLRHKIAFAHAGYKATIYDRRGRNIIAANLPMIRVRDIEVRIERDDGGVPFRLADFKGIIPLTAGLVGNEQVAVTSIRQGTTKPYEIVEIDDDETRWVMFLDMKQREREIGSG